MAMAHSERVESRLEDGEGSSGKSWDRNAFNEHNINTMRANVNWGKD